MSKTILHVSELNVAGTDGRAITDVNLDVREGEIHVLIGKKGSGKNLVFEALSGISPNVTGKVLYNNKSINLNNNFKGCNEIASVPRHPHLINNLSATENLFLFTYYERSPVHVIRWSRMHKEASKILGRYALNINPRAKVSLLSTEERKILELAKFELANSQVTIFYEPTDDLGLNSIDRFHQSLLKRKSEGKSFLIITEHWEDSLQIADRISVISNGQLIGTIAADNARQNPHELLNMLLGKPDKGDKILDTVFKAAEFLTSEYELSDVLSFVAKQALDIMNAQQCVLDLVDEDTNSLIDRVSYCLNSEKCGQVDRDKILKFFKSGHEVLHVTSEDPDFMSFFLDTGGAKTLLCMPVLIRSRTKGFIQLLYDENYECTDGKLAYLAALARQAAIAIEDTRLMGRSALLMESHHRIKNNLQSVVSLINIQRDFIDRGKTQDINEILSKITSRISSIAFVHDLLSRDEYGRSIISLDKLIEIISDFHNMDDRVLISLNIQSVFISYNKATAIALIINELINNCFEHAFPGDTSGVIKINCKRTNDYLMLEVIDNGVGLGEDFDLRKLDSLGLSITRAIILNEFTGEIRIINRSDTSGTHVSIKLPVERCLI